MSMTSKLVLTPDGGAPDMSAGSIFFVGTATVLIRYAGFTILTDPNFLHRGEKVALGYGLRSTRLTEPAMDIEDLPPLDLVVLSHMHEDHFDRVAAEKLDRDVPIVTTTHAAAALKKMGFKRPSPLRTWEEFVVLKGETELRITSMPGTHAPGVLSRLLPPVMGSFLQFGLAGSDPLIQMYITGDTLVHEQLKEIPQRFPHTDLALLHLGGTRVLGLMLTMDGKQGVEAMKIVNPDRAIPIHYNDYTVFKSPLSDFKREVEAAGLADRVRYLTHGDRYTFQVAQSR